MTTAGASSRGALVHSPMATTALGDLRLNIEIYLDETVYSVHPEDYRVLCERLYSAGFDVPRCLSGADMDYGFRVALHLQSLETKAKATVRVDFPYNPGTLPSVSDLWGGVEWHEREAYDLVGIVFSGHPDPRRILLEDHWTIHPLQRKYDTRGYLIPGWEAKPFPVPAIWEPKPTEESVPAEKATTEKPARAVAATPSTPTVEASSTATPPSSSATPTAPATAEATPAAEGEKKAPKRWVPKDGAAKPVASSAAESSDTTARPEVAPDAPTDRAPANTAAMTDAATGTTTAPTPSELTPAPEANSSARSGEQSAEQGGEAPKKAFKRWEPKKKEGE